MRISDPKFSLLRSGCLLLAFAATAFAQTGQPPQNGEERSYKEDVPVLLMHLPAWEEKIDSALFFNENEQFRMFFNSRKIIEAVDFFPGTEAAFAKYPEGELLIVEYSTPQASSEIDKSVNAMLGASGEGVVYQRIGNYNVFLFDPSDPIAGKRLIDQIKYEKVVTWPYGNPKPYFEKERAFILEASSLFISTVLFILTGIGTAILLGAAAGVIYFQANTRKRAAMSAFSDAGGLTRLNLDGFTPDLISNKLLDD